MARIITSEPFTGWRTCGRPRIADDGYGPEVLEEDCPSYVKSQPCEVVREEVQFTFADNGAKATPGMNVDSVERSSIRILPADGDWSCPDCGFEMSTFTVEPRPNYPHVSEQHPDELRRRSLRQDRVADQQLSAAERQAAALETLVQQGDQSAKVAQLEAMVAELMARMNKKGES